MGNMVCAREEGTPLVSQQGTDLLANLKLPTAIGPQISHVNNLETLWEENSSPAKF